MSQQELVLYFSSSSWTFLTSSPVVTQDKGEQKMQESHHQVKVVSFLNIECDAKRTKSAIQFTQSGRQFHYNIQNYAVTKEGGEDVQT